MRTRLDTGGVQFIERTFAVDGGLPEVRELSRIANQGSEDVPEIDGAVRVECVYDGGRKVARRYVADDTDTAPRNAALLRHLSDGERLIINKRATVLCV